jgi:hypothetical protein
MAQSNAARSAPVCPPETIFKPVSSPSFTALHIPSRPAGFQSERTTWPRDHLSAQYHEALCRIGAKVFLLARQRQL